MEQSGEELRWSQFEEGGAETVSDGRAGTRGHTPHGVHVLTSEMFPRCGLLLSCGSAKKVQNFWQLLAFGLQTSVTLCGVEGDGGHAVVLSLFTFPHGARSNTYQGETD